MKTVSLSLIAIIFLVLTGHAVVYCQTSAVYPLVIKPDTVAHNGSERDQEPNGHPILEPEPADAEPPASRFSLPALEIAVSESDVVRHNAAVRGVFGERHKFIFPLDSDSPSVEPELRLDLTASLDAPRFIDDPPSVFIDDPPKPDSIEINSGFQWRQAINQSMILIGIQHGYALVAQEKTRRALKGPFFRDYWRSVKGLKGWDDGNRFFTNYIAHPMQGGLTGFIYVQNSPRAMQQQFGESKQYWKDRFTAFLWSTAWSTQWELGPISQSSIGNVGMYGGMGYVDLVITPTVGTGWLIAEEAIDRYVIRKIETMNDTVRKLTRMLLNPMRSVANLLRFKHPWYRDRPVGY